MENIIEDEFGEFDIQTTVLKKRTVDLKQSVYVEYDKLNYSVVAISPINITPSVTRNKVQVVDQTDLTNKVFSNKISLSKLIVKKDSKTNKVELQYIKPTFKSEFDYIFATNDERSFIHIECDVVSKTMEVIFDYELFNEQYSMEYLLESTLAEFPEQIALYCIDKFERSKLFVTITIDLSNLFRYHSIRYSAPWLPNSTDTLDNIGFVYYNDSQKISVGTAPKIRTNKVKYRANVLYSQDRNVLKLQSNMQNISSFYTNEYIVLYSYAIHDPSKMLGTYKVSRDQFNNYNYFEIPLKTSQKVKIVSDCFHLQIEESNVNSD
jgi:hypothetical protein